MPKSDRGLSRDGHGARRVVVRLNARLSGHEAVTLYVGQGAELALEVAALLEHRRRSIRCFVDRRKQDLPKAVPRDELRPDAEGFAAQPQDNSRGLDRWQAERGARGHRDAATVGGAEQARAGVPQLARWNEQHGLLHELPHHIEVDVRADAMDGASARPYVGERTGKECRIREGDPGSVVLGDPERRECVEARLPGRGMLRAGAVRRAENDRGPQCERAKVQESLEPQREDAPVRAHRLDGERCVDAQRVNRLASRATVPHMLEHAPVACREAGGRRDVAAGQELPLARQANDDRERP
ncbi:MAG: hypothetical protein M3O50_03650 [Myxococcota bacterium]|nr:hypothetical protein [Myxococcota bacterium]